MGKKKGRKKGKPDLGQWKNVRTARFCLEPRAEMRACTTCSDAFMVNCKSSFFLEQAAHTATREAGQTEEKDWVLGPKEHLEEKSRNCAVKQKSGNTENAFTQRWRGNFLYRRNRKHLLVLGQLFVTEFLLVPLSGMQRFTREQISFECRQYDHIYAHIHEWPLLTLS